MRLLSPDELSDEQRACLELYKPLIPEGAVCVNVMLGAEAWDVRPLVLEGKQVSICRISREMPEAECKAQAAELEGFSVVDFCPSQVFRAPGVKRFLLKRPYVAATLKDQLDSGEVKPGAHNESLLQQLLAHVRELKTCSLIHGHLCPGNLAIVDGALCLLDPFIGAVNGTDGKTVAPELSPGSEPSHATDLFGLGVSINAILGSTGSPEQQQMVKRLMLPSPRQRPALEDVEAVFRAGNAGSSQASSGAGGRMIKRAPSPSDRKDGGRVGTAQTPGQAQGGSRSKLITLVAVLLALAVVAGSRISGIYETVLGTLLTSGSERRAELESKWKSGDAEKMRAVARDATVGGDAVAEEVIVDSVMNGENPPSTTARLMRVALNDLWRDDLSDKDIDAVVRLTVAPLFKEGLDTLPPLSALHPGVILAVAGEMPPGDPAPQLKLLPIATFVKLPDPFGSAFKQLSELGVSSAGAPESVALAAIMSGLTGPRLFDAFMGPDTAPKVAVAKLSIIYPIVQGNDGAAAQLVASIRDKGGELGQVLGWFDIEDLAQWSKMSGAQKLALALNRLPETALTQSQYADLMTFPLPGVREQAALELKKKYFRDGDGNLLLTLSGAGNRLSREQTIALVSALALEPAKRAPFISAWFGLKPAPDTVLLVLLARGGYDSTDTFNLEAARYLRRHQWSATTDMLQLLAQHPEPLARTLAYTKLDPKDDAQKKILQDRISAEKDKGLLKMVMGRLSVDTPATPAPSSATP